MEHVAGIRGLLCLALLAGGLGCGGEGKGDPVYETTLGVLDAGGNPAATFAPGQPITFKLSITNRTTVTQSLNFTSTHQHEFLVIGAGQSTAAWRWSFGKVFATVMTDLDFVGQETKVFTTTWTQVDNAGNPVASGIYDAQGHAATAEEVTKTLASDFTPSAVRSSRVVFTIQ